MTEFQAKLLQYLKAYVKEHGYSPTNAEIRADLGCGNGRLYTAFSRLRRMRRIDKYRGLWRGIELKGQK